MNGKPKRNRGQWAKGVSGNLNGRPPLTDDGPLARQARQKRIAKLQAPMKVRRGGKEISLPTHLLVLDKMIQDALVNNNGASQWRLLKLFQGDLGSRDAENKELVEMLDYIEDAIEEAKHKKRPIAASLLELVRNRRAELRTR